MSDIPVFLAPILEDLSSARSSSNRRRRALTKLDGLLATLLASILIPLASRLLPQFHSQVVSSAKPVDFQPTLSELIGIFQVVQGVCLLHQPSKNLIGGRRSTMEMILDLLLLTRHVPSFATSLSGSAQTDLSLSSLLASTLLDTLFAALVDSSRNTRTFEQAGGLECLMRMLKGKTVPKDVRVKSLEFLFFYLLPEGQARAQGQMIGASGVDHPIELRGGINLEDLPILLASPRQLRPSSRLTNVANTTADEDRFHAEGYVPSTPNSSRMYQVETPSTQIRTRVDKHSPHPTSNSHARRPSTPSSLGSPPSQHAYLHQTPVSIAKHISQRSASPSPRRTARMTDLKPPALITTTPSSSEMPVSYKQTTTSNLASHGLGISTSFPSPRRASTPDTPGTSKLVRVPARRSERSESDFATSSSATVARPDQENISNSTVEKTRGRPVLHAQSTSSSRISSDRASKRAAYAIQTLDAYLPTDQSSLGILKVTGAPASSNNTSLLPSPSTSPSPINRRLTTPPAASTLLSSTCVQDLPAVTPANSVADHRPVIQIQSPSRTSNGHETPSRYKNMAKGEDDRRTSASRITLNKLSARSTPQSHRTDRVLPPARKGGPEEKEDLFSSPRAIISHDRLNLEENKKNRERTRSSGLMLPPKDIPAHRRAAPASLDNGSDSTTIPSLTRSHQPQSSTRRVQVPAEASSHKASASQSPFNFDSIPLPSTDHPKPVEEPLSVHPVFLSSSQTPSFTMLPLPSPTMSNSTVSPSIASDGSLSPYMTPSTSPYLLSNPHLSPDLSLPSSSSSSFPSPSRSPSKSSRIRQSRPPSAARSPRGVRSDARWGEMNGRGNMAESKSDGVRTVQEKKALLSVYLGDLDRLMGALGTPAK
ncbi:Cell division protein Cdc14 [Phaffia rhodozyma]|uniref:Cell division protein Cdc14 n=1 Tax=Phaffia rhodozyma TaxID=264483 RepID=A0A0F7SN21_PHARH|nr:Cell division protein Cdc14 [Phaffia rhodozyma]